MLKVKVVITIKIISYTIERNQNTIWRKYKTNNINFILSEEIVIDYVT